MGYFEDALKRKPYTAPAPNMSTASGPVYAPPPNAVPTVEKSALLNFSSGIASGISSGAGEFAKAVVRAPFRAAQSVALDYLNPAGGSQITPQTSFEKLIFGREPVKAVSTQFKEAHETLKSGGYGKAAGPIAAVAAFGGVVLDLTPFGGSRKKLSEQLLKETTEEGAKLLLSKAGIADDLIKTYAPKFAKAKTTKEVEAGLKALEYTAKITNAATELAPTTIKKAAGILEPKLNIEASKQIATEAIDFAKKNPDSFLVGKQFRNKFTKELEGGPRLFKRIGESLRNGEISVDNLPGLAREYNLPQEEVAKLFEDAATYAGKTLRSLSKVEKELRALLPDIEITKRVPTLWERFKSNYLAVDNFRRSLLVTQLATAMRNAFTQAGRYTIGTATDAMNGVIGKVTGQAEAFTPFFEDIAAVVRKLSPGNSKKLQEVLKSYPLEHARLYNTPVSDVALSGKVSNLLNTFNRGQEYFYRNLILDAKLNAAAKRLGTQIDKLPVEDFKKAIDEALDWTFSKSPSRGSFGDAIMNMYKAMPPLTLVNPFPRFMANGLKFLYEFSPLGVMSLFKSETRAAIAAGDPTVISKAIIGTGLLSGALAVRANDKVAGEKWYEIKVGDKTLDMRPFAPFSTYLFFAEVMLRGGERISGSDWAQAAIGINRVAGTGLALIDLIGEKVDEQSVKNIVNNIVSSYIGGFTVPFGTIKDIIGNFDLEERTIKDAQQLPIFGRAISNIPFLQKVLPTKYSLFEDKPLERESPLLRQATGLTLTTKPFIQQELDRLGKDVGDLIPKTGILEANRILIKQTGVILDQFNDKIELSDNYKNLSDAEKLNLLGELISEAKSEAKGQVASDLAAVAYNELKKVSSDKRREVMKTLHNKGLLTDNILEYLLPMLEAQPLK